MCDKCLGFNPVSTLAWLCPLFSSIVGTLALNAQRSPERIESFVFSYGPQEPLLATVKKRKLAWFGHVTCHHSLSKTILQGTLESRQRRSRQMKCWMDNIKKWTSLAMPELLTRASCRKDWKWISAESSLMSPEDPIG